MIIHNFFSDTLLSVLELFERYIFNYKPYLLHTVTDQPPGSFFKSVQFNIGNRNYQIGNYKDSGQLEFPTGIFTFVSDETAFGKSAGLIDHHRVQDVNEIICTHNKNTNVDICLREEQAILYLTVQINCESIHQANEVVHQIKRFLPPSKYIQMMNFSSFLQIPSWFFDSKNNNPNKHTIENLYMKYDSTVGESDYYYLAHYKPLIRLNSVNADISENSARSFSVLCDFSYLIQLPMWMFDTLDEKKVTRIDLGLSISDNLSSIIFDDDFLSTDEQPTKINDTFYSSKERYIVEEKSSNFSGGRIIVPKPSGDNYIIKITKIGESKSTVIKKTDNDFSDGLYSNEHTILNDGDYTTNDKNLIIFTSDRKELTPELNYPVIVNVIYPMDNELLDKINKSKQIFNKSKIYEIRNQKTWRTI